MTKHLDADEGGLLVVVGWERGRQMFYLTLYGERNKVVYDSDHERVQLTLAFVEMVMERHGLTLRADVRVALMRDQAVNAAPYAQWYEQASEVWAGACPTSVVDTLLFFLGMRPGPPAGVHFFPEEKTTAPGAGGPEAVTGSSPDCACGSAGRDGCSADTGSVVRLILWP